MGARGLGPFAWGPGDPIVQSIINFFRSGPQAGWAPGAVASHSWAPGGGGPGSRVPYPARPCWEIPAPQGGERSQLLRGAETWTFPVRRGNLQAPSLCDPGQARESLPRRRNWGGGESRGRSRVARALGATPTHSSPRRPPPRGPGRLPVASASRRGAGPNPDRAGGSGLGGGEQCSPGGVAGATMGQGRAEGVGGSARQGQDPGTGPAPLLRTRGGGRGRHTLPGLGGGPGEARAGCGGAAPPRAASDTIISFSVKLACCRGRRSSRAAGRRLDRRARAVAAAAAKARPPRLDPLPGAGTRARPAGAAPELLLLPGACFPLSRPPVPNPRTSSGDRARRGAGPPLLPAPSSSGLWSDLSNFPFRRQRGPPSPPPCAPPSRASRARPPSSLRTFGIAVERRAGGTQPGRSSILRAALSGGRLRASPRPPLGPAAPPSSSAGSGGAAAVAVAGGASCRGGSSRRPGAQQVRAASSPLLLLFLRSPARGSSQWRPCSAGPAPAPLPLPAQSDSGHRLLAAPLSGCLCPPPGPGALRTPAAFCCSLAGTHLGHPATEAGWLLTPSSQAAEGVGRSLYCVCLWGAGGVTEFPGHLSCPPAAGGLGLPGHLTANTMESSFIGPKPGTAVETRAHRVWVLSDDCQVSVRCWRAISRLAPPPAPAS